MNRSEYEAIAKQAGEAAFGQAMGILGNEEDARDVAQDVMVQLWTMHVSLTPTEMLRMAPVMGRNRAVDLWRHNRHVMPFSPEVSCAGAPSPLDIMESDEAVQRILRLIDTLPPTEMLVLRMRQVERKTNEEIAEILQITPRSVGTLLSRARHRLKERIEKM